MRKIVYMMNFKGRRSQASSGSKLRTTSSATSCVVSTVVRTTGVETDCRAFPGELAFLESESRLTGPGLFEEDGVIAFGDNEWSPVALLDTRPRLSHRRSRAWD